MTPWSGSVLAAGFVFDETLVGREVLVKRLLAAWSDGARLARSGARWYLVGLAPRRVDARVSPGAPLVWVEGRWLVGSVDEEVLRAAPMDAVLECRDSEPLVVRFDSLTAAHPAELLSLEVPVALAARELAPPPVPVVKVRPAASLDALFGPMLTALPRALVPLAPAPPRPSLWARILGWFSRGREAPLPDPLPGGARGIFGFLRRAPPEPEPLDTVDDFRNEPPDSQRRYLEDLRRRFDLGDLAEALRRAIPLGGAGGGPGRATHAAPPRRESLSLLAPNARGGASMVMPSDEFEQMKKMYRAAADALIEKGQIEEAAYVLAKLLNDSLAAVALLEKHNRFELAAQLATTQGLPPVDRIRLWLLAGRKDEAIRVARASNDFEALISTMSGRWPELALQLRVAWGEFLAEHHRYTEALVATSRLPSPPEAWPTWLEHALDAGGASAVTALAVDVARHPTHGDEVRAQLTTLLHDDPRSTLTRTAAQVMLEHAPKAPGPLYRDVWRGLMRGASRGDVVDRQLVDRVLRATGDQPLALDAVPSAPSTLRAAQAPLELPRPVVSSLPVLDVAPLPKGRKVLAHGAAGLRIVSATGETLRHLLVKADGLVAGPIGAPVLVLSRDGALTRTWKLDAHQFTVTSWFQAHLSAWPRRYDGLTWAVGMEDSLVMLDPAAPSAMEWWRVPNLACSAIDTSGSNVIVLATDAQKETRRRVFSPDPQLEARRSPASTDVFVRADGLRRVWSSRTREDGQFEVTSGERVVLLPASAQWHTWPMEVGVLFVRVLAGNTEVLLIDWERFELRVLARLAGTTQVKVRDLTPERLALCDEHGRVTELDL